MERIDLHIHSSASDSSEAPQKIVELAVEDGLKAIAITDHDTVDGYKKAMSSSAAGKIELVPGIELSTKYYGSVHILGYFIDVDNRELNEELQKIVDDRDTRNEKIIQMFREAGINITYDEMRDRFGKIIGRPHLGKILVENGLASSVSDAFENLLGKNQKFWVPRKTMTIEKSVQLIKNAGGIAVIAHSFEYSYDVKTLADLIEYGIRCGIRGLECRHSSHTPGEMAYLERLAEDYDLLKTGGSDFHGSIKPDISLGTGKGLLVVPYKWFEALKKERNA